MPVYFIQDEGGEIKIGYSDGNPYRRLNTFRTGNPRELTLLVAIPGGSAEEGALHERFADLRGRGEWFRPDARLLGFIEAMQHVYKDRQPPAVQDGDTDASVIWTLMKQVTGAAKAAAALDHVAASFIDVEYNSLEMSRGMGSRAEVEDSLQKLDDAMSNYCFPLVDDQFLVSFDKDTEVGIRCALERWSDGLGYERGAAAWLKDARELYLRVKSEIDKSTESQTAEPH